MSNLTKDNVVPVKTFPPIINWQFAFFTFASYTNVIAVKNGC